MAYPLVQIVNSAGTVQFDLNDDTGVNNLEYGSLKTWTLDEDFDLGAPEVTLTTSTPRGVGTSTLVHQQHGLAEMTLRCSVKGTSVDNLRTGVGALQRLVAAGGILKWQPDSASEIRYVDFLAASEIPQIWRGQGEPVVTVFLSYADMDGLLIRLVRQPYLRGALLARSSNTFLNATLLTDANGNGNPDDWTSVGTVTSPSIVAATEAAQFSGATTGDHGYRQVVTTGVAAADNWTFSIEGQIVSGAVGRYTLRLEALSAADAVLGTQSLDVSTTAWTRSSVTYTNLPATSTKVRASFLSNTTGAGTAVYQFRRAQLEEASAATPFHTGTETVLTDPAGINGRILPIYISGDAPAPVTLDIEPSTGTTGLTSTLIAVLSNDGVTGKGSLTEYMNSRHMIQCEAGTLGTDATLVADAAASPGSGNSAVNISYVTTPTINSLRLTSTTTTLLDSFKGKTFDVYVRAAHTVASTVTTFTLQTSHATVAVNEAVVSPAVTFTSTADMAGLYKDVKLGTVYFPTQIGGFVFTLLSARPSGTGALRLDSYFLVPVDKSVSLLSVAWAANLVPGESFYSDPETGFVESFSTASTYMRSAVSLSGPQPVTLPPGLNLLYMHFGSATATGSTADVSLLGQTSIVSHEYKPRYYH